MDVFQKPVKKLGQAFKNYGEWIAGHKSRPFYMLAVGIAVIVLLAPGMVVAGLRDAEEPDTEDLFTPRISTGEFRFLPGLNTSCSDRRRRVFRRKRNLDTV